MRREAYDEDLHIDCWTRAPSEDGTGLVKEWIEDLVLSDPYYPEINVVEDRLCTLINQGEDMSDSGIFNEQYGILVFTPCENPTVCETFVCLSKPLLDSSPGRNPDGSYCDNVEP